MRYKGVELTNEMYNEIKEILYNYYGATRIKKFTSIQYDNKNIKQNIILIKIDYISSLNVKGSIKLPSDTFHQIMNRVTESR